jgi:hypothetical protein
MTEQAPTRRRRYLDVEMPARFELQFQTDNGEWMGEAVCVPEQFEQLENGAYIRSGFGSGLWIRCIAHHDGHFDHVDGEGEVFRYRTVPLPAIPGPGED